MVHNNSVTEDSTSQIIKAQTSTVAATLKKKLEMEGSFTGSGNPKLTVTLSSQYSRLVDTPVIAPLAAKQSYIAVHPGVICIIENFHKDQDERNFNLITKIHFLDLAVEIFPVAWIGLKTSTGVKFEI